MKKRIVAAAAFAACLALCAAVWTQSEPDKETPVQPTPSAVIATQHEVPEQQEIEESIIPEEEKADVTRPEPTPIRTPPVSEVQTTPEQNATPLQEVDPAPASPDSTQNNMVYVPGFGWIECQGPNHCEYAEDMYENGNKIGRMN